MQNKILSYKRESFRKAIHMLTIVIPILYMILDKMDMMIFMVVISVLMLMIDFYRRSDNVLSKYFYKFLGKVIRPYESENLMSSTYLIIASLLIIMLVPEKYKFIPILAISYASICDSFAALYGIKFGKTHLVNNKTLEGSLVFVISGLLVTYLYLSFYLRSDLFIFTFDYNNVIYFYLCPFLTSIVELFTLTEYDNLSVPVFSTLFLTIVVFI